MAKNTRTQAYVTGTHALVHFHALPLLLLLLLLLLPPVSVSPLARRTGSGAQGDAACSLHTSAMSAQEHAVHAWAPFATPF